MPSPDVLGAPPVLRENFPGQLQATEQRLMASLAAQALEHRLDTQRVQHGIAGLERAIEQHERAIGDRTGLDTTLAD